MHFAVTSGTAAVQSVTQYLAGHVWEISYLLSTVLMFFGGDIIMEKVLLKRLKQWHFLKRTLAFVLYGLVLLPALTVGGAALLRAFVLEPLQDRILPVLLVSFLATGISLSVKYNMKPRLKGR